MFEFSETESHKSNGARIKVIGVGGGGCNAVNSMIKAGLSGVEYIVANTDAQALNVSLAPTKIQIGATVTKGLGAGANPEIGKKSALEDYEKIGQVLKNADMVFITAGMGGGTGTGAAPVIARLAKEFGALTVAVVTKPFAFEGKKRFRQAEEGIKSLEESVDSLITIPNQRLYYLAGEELPIVDTFKKADEVLLNAVRGISDLINNTGLINADFADVSTVMANKGLALMGTGTASGSGRAIKAATDAISSPLLEDVSINGATGIIINITGSDSLTMHETNEAVTLIMEAADENAEIIFGTVIDNNCGDEVKITVIATGLGGKTKTQTQTQTTQTTQTVAPKIVAEEPVTATAATPVFVQPAVVKQPEVITTAPVEFDRFMSDKNHFISSRESEESEVVHNHQAVSGSDELKRPSRLVQSIREAANRYETPSSSSVGQATTTASTSSSSALNNKEPEISSRAKSIAEKLGFINFDDDEFDTPSFLRKDEVINEFEEKGSLREFKDFEI